MKDENRFKINSEIKAKTVKLVGDNITPGIYVISEAIRISDELNLDLVEISGAVEPPICKVMDFNKFLYERKKNTKKQPKVDIKELRLSPTIGDNDFMIKIKQAYGFLEKGNSVKLIVKFKGREMAHKDIGENRIKSFITELLAVGTVEFNPKFEGNRLMVIMKPKPKK